MLSAFKNFLVTFLIAALLFGVVGYFATTYLSGIITGILDGDTLSSTPVVNAPSEEENKNDDENTEDLKVPDGNSFTFLVLGTDYRPDIFKNYYRTVEDYQKVIEKARKNSKNVKSDELESVLQTNVRYIRATWIAVVRADKENREFAVCYLSPETAVSAPYGESTLGEIYGLYGIDVFCEYINAMTGLEMNYRFVLDGIHQLAFADTMGEEIKFDLKCDLYAGKKYHLSSPEVGDTADTEGTDGAFTDTESLEAGDTVDPAENADSETSTAEAEENTPVLKAGEHVLNEYSVHIINTFKEGSQSDIDAKSSYILEMIKKYLTICAKSSAEELAKKIDELTSLDGEYDINEPYSTKPILATEFTADEVEYIHSMLQAIEYFDYTEFIYPGAYSEIDKTYQPDIKSALSTFEKYRNTSDDTEATE